MAPEDCFLERQPGLERRNSLFLSLAVVFGAVGTVSSLRAGSGEAIIGDNPGTLYAGSRMVSTDHTSAFGVSCSIKDGDESCESIPEVSSQSQKLHTALMLIL